MNLDKLKNLLKKNKVTEEELKEKSTDNIEDNKNENHSSKKEVEELKTEDKIMHILSYESTMEPMDTPYVINETLKIAIENTAGILVESEEDMKSLGGILDLSYDKTLVYIEDYNGIDALRGLEAAVNITSLYLQGNKIKTIEELSALSQLTWLDISDNAIEDISAITTNLVNLQGLVVDNNKLKKNAVTNIILPSFDNLTKLEVLRLNSITNDGLSDEDLSNISSLDKVYTIDLCNNGITSIGSSSNPLIPNLKGILSLGLSGNKIDDISVLEGLESIERLCLKENLLTALVDLSKAVNLQVLYLDGNNITKIGDSISTLKNLELLSLDDNKVEDLEKLPILCENATLYLNNCNIGSLNILQENKQLGVLELKDNNIKSLNGIEELKNLQLLILDNNKISDIGLLANLTNLSAISLNDNSIKDISPLKNIEDYIHEQNQINNTNNVLTISAINQKINIDIKPIISNVTTLNLTNMIKDVHGNIPNIPNVYPAGKGNYDQPLITWRDVGKFDLLYFQFDNYPTTATSYFNGTVIESIIDIKDANLKVALNKKIANKPLNSDITREELEGLTDELDLSNSNISKLEGLEYARNITGLNLSQNKLTDIAPLGSMTNLKTINIDNNQIIDLSPVLPLKLDSFTSQVQSIQYENKIVKMNSSLGVSLDYLTGNGGGVVIDISEISNDGKWDNVGNNVVWKNVNVGGIYKFNYTVDFGESALELDDENIMYTLAANIQSAGTVTFRVNIEATRGIRLF